MPIQIRPARAEDQRAITHIVRSARINPFDLNWRRFLVAEVDGQLAGVGQIRHHRDGSRELASIATVPAFRRRGVAAAVIRAWLEREQGTLYLICRTPLEEFYRQFGFRRADGQDLHGFLALAHRFSRLGGGLVMVHDGAGQAREEQGT